MWTWVTYWSLVCTSKIRRKGNICFVLFLCFRLHSQNSPAKMFQAVFLISLQQGSVDDQAMKHSKRKHYSSGTCVHKRTDRLSQCPIGLPSKYTIQEITAIMAIKLVPSGAFSHCKPSRNTLMQTSLFSLGQWEWRWKPRRHIVLYLEKTMLALAFLPNSKCL